jgi:hypothetical protein
MGHLDDAEERDTLHADSIARPLHADVSSRYLRLPHCVPCTALSKPSGYHCDSFSSCSSSASAAAHRWEWCLR